MTENINESGLSRRNLVKAAAWATPVIATAVAVPFASASITNKGTTLAVASGSNLAIGGGNAIGSTVSGTFGGSATVTNKGIGWNIDAVTANYYLEGPVTANTLTYNGQPLSGSTITDNGYTWSIDWNDPGNVGLTLISPLPVIVPPNGSVTVPVPALGYLATLTNTAQYNPISRRVRASLTTVVTSGSSTLDDTNTKSYPAS